MRGHQTWLWKLGGKHHIGLGCTYIVCLHLGEILRLVWHSTVFWVRLARMVGRYRRNMHAYFPCIHYIEVCEQMRWMDGEETDRRYHR